MKKFATITIPVFVFLTISISCQHEESVSPTQDPNYANVDLNIHLRYPDMGTYDSAYIVFKNSTTEIKLQLMLNNPTQIATGNGTSIPFGKWEVSASYFNTLTKDYKSLETSEVVSLEVTSTSTDLISDETGVYIKDGSDAIKKSFNREDYYYFQLYLDNTLEGVVRLPLDPTNPFVEILTFNPKWTYAYADRNFFRSSSDMSSSFHQGGGAFEIYGEFGDTHDRLERDIIDTLSLKPGISQVKDKVWNDVSCILTIYGDEDELSLFHRWDLRTSGGRIKTNSDNAERKKN